VLTISSSGKNYALAICGLLRKLYRKLPALRFSAVPGVKSRVDSGSILSVCFA